MIYIQDHNRDAILIYLKLSGVKCSFKKIKDFSLQCETNFSNNSVPEQNRIKAGCSLVWTDEKGVYTITIKRFTGGYWGLVSAKGEPFKHNSHTEVKSSIVLTAVETSNNYLIQGSGSS